MSEVGKEEKSIQDYLKEMQDIDIMTVDRNTLTDLRDVKIDTRKSMEERVKSFVEQAGNPYLVKVGEYVVKIGYSEEGVSINERMKSYITKMVEIRY